jgi:2-methylcitrate dehydratase PrpD
VRPFSGRLADISDLEARIHPAFNVVVGAANANAYEPQNIEHVQFSLPTQMAFALLGKGNGYAVHRDYLDGKIDMAQVMAIARGIRIIEAPELEQRYPGKFVADVTVTFRDGMSEHVFVEDPVGTLANPMSENDQDAKFMELTAGVLGNERARTLLAMLRKMDLRTKAADLTGMCTA